MMASKFRFGPGIAPLLMATLIAVALNACGPGVGGTGVGAEPQLSAFGATAATVCSSDLATALSCTAGSSAASAPGLPTAGDPSLLAGTTPVVFADAKLQVRLTLSGNRAELSSACGPLAFTGEFGQVQDQMPRFYGAAESSAYSGPASLQVLRDTNGLVVTVSGGSGQILLGPLALIAVAQQTMLAACNP